MWAHRFYLYKNGCYRKTSSDQIKKKILNVYDETVTSHKVNDVFNLLSLIATVLVDEVDDRRYLNVINGLFDLKTRTLIPHSPDVLSTIQLNVKYDPNAKADLWRKSIKEIFEDAADAIDLIQEYFGLCLTTITKHELALILLV